MEHVDCIVIGAGVVGLSIARALALKGKEVFILDKEASFGMETSSRNSEVIHAGIYYPQGSLKAKFCVKGREMLYQYCQERHINHKKCGKLIVACTENEIKKLSAIKEKAEQNGVSDLRFLDKDEVLQKEPELSAVAGLHSPSTGILDSHSFMLSLLGDIENNGGIFVPKSKVIGGRVLEKGFVLTVQDVESSDQYEIKTNNIINSAGLYAADMLKNMKGFPKQKIPKIYYAKGSYFSLSSKTRFSHLIYPVPEVGGLGVHLTLDLDGNAKFGPNVQWVDDINFDVDDALRGVFYSHIIKYWPNLNQNDLVPGYSGIRPKTSPQGVENDFVIQTSQDHGIKNMVNLYGMESPGLTSSLAIAEHVATYF